MNTYFFAHYLAEPATNETYMQDFSTNTMCSMHIVTLGLIYISDVTMRLAIVIILE